MRFLATSTVLDFDQAGLYPQYEALADDNGLGELVRRLAMSQTPSDGRHLIYRSTEPVGGNRKLAQAAIDIPVAARFVEEGGREYVFIAGKKRSVVVVDGQKKALETAIETRGEEGVLVRLRQPVTRTESRMSSCAAIWQICP